MAEINKVPNQPPTVSDQVARTNEAAEKLGAQTSRGENPVGRGTVGQPTGLPSQVPLTQNALMPEVVTGRDLSQLIAADKLRSNGGALATDILLGLNQQPSVLGGLLAPPGNLEALRHLTPAMRRNILRNLLAKQRDQMRRLVAVARDDERHQQDDEQSGNGDEGSFTSDDLIPVSANGLTENGFHNRRVYQDLASTTKMLDLLDDLLNMQDYTLSQMGTFAHG